MGAPGIFRNPPPPFADGLCSAAVASIRPTPKYVGSWPVPSSSWLSSSCGGGQAAAAPARATSQCVHSASQVSLHSHSKIRRD
eukprot:3184866-Pyramimonas_sp.AAC.1